MLKFWRNYPKMAIFLLFFFIYPLPCVCPSVCPSIRLSVPPSRGQTLARQASEPARQASEPARQASEPASQALEALRLAWLALRPGWMGLKPTWLALGPSRGEQMDRQMDGWMDGQTDWKSPHSTGLCPLSGLLPHYSPTLTQKLYQAGQGHHWPYDASWHLVKYATVWLYFTLFNIRRVIDIFDREECSKNGQIWSFWAISW